MSVLLLFFGLLLPFDFFFDRFVFDLEISRSLSLTLDSAISELRLVSVIFSLFFWVSELVSWVLEEAALILFFFFEFFFFGGLGGGRSVLDFAIEMATKLFDVWAGLTAKFAGSIGEWNSGVAFESISSSLGFSGFWVLSSFSPSEQLPSSADLP